MMPPPGTIWRPSPDWTSPNTAVSVSGEASSAAPAANPAPLLPMQPLAAQPGGAPVRPDAGFSALWTWPTPIHPSSGLSITSTMPTSLTRFRTVVKTTPTPRRLQQAVQNFWRTAPSDLKWLALALPIIIGVVLYSTRGPANRASANSQPVSRPAATRDLPRPAEEIRATPAPQPSPAVVVVPAPAKASSTSVPALSKDGALERQWQQMRVVIEDRAAVDLLEEFRAGLGAWDGGRDWARTWGYDRTGSVRIGNFALYRPSLGLSDYQFDFLATVEAHGIGWVYRAQDANNYYATRLVIPRPESGVTPSIIHYAVVNGREVVHRDLPLPIALRPDTYFQVHTEVAGNGFTTSIQGQVVDYWTDSRLTQGGVGFFVGKGEQARLRWVEVLNHYDAIGRLCALIAPHHTQSNDGSSK